MEKGECPNAIACILINNQDFVNKEQRERYIKNFCRSVNANFNACKRYQTSQKFHFCPDFVLPDTTLHVNEIIEKYDEGND